MLWTWVIFLAITLFLVARHVRATRGSGATTLCARCKAKIPAGAQRCGKCGIPLQVMEVTGAAIALDEGPEEGATHAVVRADVCVGCAACVPACPVENAIWMEGKLAVVDLSLCVGHGKCAEACPVGAIHVGAGSAVRVEVPNVDVNFQSNVPGIYVVGELGGRGLIKNAVNEGKVAAECAASVVRPDNLPENVRDIAIVGSGPSGISAGLECHSRGMDYLLLEQGTLADTIRKYPRNKLLLAEPLNVPLYGDLWVADASKETLLKAWETVIEATGLRVHTEHGVKSLTRDPGGWFEIVTTQGEFRARQVILAMGRRGTPRKLGVDGEGLEQVLYDVVEMETFAGSKVVVVGGGDSALESALGMSAQAHTEVILSYRKNDFSRAKPRNLEKLKKAEATGDLQVWRESEVRAVRPGEIDIEYGGKLRTLPNDYLVIRVGGIAPYDFLHKAGVEIIKKDVPLVGSGSDA
ncbi:4Fe-4S ferredoxin [bacterium]|nr:MAG: 4Fe-4S ferredoxin [bacterium]